MKYDIPVERRAKWLSSTIKHYDKVVDGRQQFVVSGYFTSDNPDQIGDIITKEATKKAVNKWRKIGNIRYMHQAEPVGKVLRIGEEDGLEWNEVELKVVDPKSQNLIREGVLSSMSVGIIVEDAEPVDGNEDDPLWFLTGGMKISGYTMAELSLCDHPMNLDAVLTSYPGQVHAQEQNRSYIFKSIDLDALLKKDTSTPTAGTGGPEVLAVDNNTEVSEDKAFGSDFPDAAFAVVESTGEKDEEGRTAPQNARHLPHHTKGVTDGNTNDTVDLAHYRNALARVNQIKPVTDMSKDELIKKAEAHLEKHRSVLEESLEPTKEKQVDEEKKDVVPETPPEPVTEPEPKAVEPEAKKEEGEPGEMDAMQQMMDMMRQMMDVIKQVLDEVRNAPKPTDDELAQEPEAEKTVEPEAKQEEPVTEVKAEPVEVAKAESKGDLVKAITEVMDKSFVDFLAKAGEKDEALKKEILEYIEKLRNQAQPTQAALITEEPKVEEKPQPVTPENIRKNLRERIDARFEQNKQGK